MEISEVGIDGATEDMRFVQEMSRDGDTLKLRQGEIYEEIHRAWILCE